MANAAKYKQAAVAKMFRHYDRRTNEKDVSRSNESIDPTRTHLNYDIHTGQTADQKREKSDQLERLNKRLSEVKHRDFSKFDDNKFCDWVVTLPDNVDPSKSKEFFQHVYDFCSERYGKENVISAWVHLDETTPHMHFAFVPVVKNDDGTESLCAKKVISRTELNRFHPALMKYMEDKMQQSVAILNGATAGGNLTIIELKIRDELKRLAELQAETGSLEKLNPIIEETMTFAEEVRDSFRRIDEALQTKKWFGSDERAKMKALFAELDELKKDTEKVSETMDKLKDKLRGLGANIDDKLTSTFKAVDEMRATAERRIKRTENKLKRREERVEKKERNADELIRQGIQQGVQRELDKRKDEIAELDSEIALKQQQLNATNTDFWSSQGYLRTAQTHQQQFTDTLKEWSEQLNESKNVKPTLPKR